MQARKWLWTLGVVVALLVSYVPCTAQSADKEGTRLNQRIDRLEKEIAELRKSAPDVSTGLIDIGQANKMDLWSSLDIQLYGYIKADASYDTSRTTTGNYVLYVDSEATNENDDEFNLTAKETRLGMNISGPANDTTKAAGCIEFDFYDSNATENQANIQMRHAYLTLDWPEAQFSILAGQTCDVMSPLLPTTLNYTVLWNAGNIGYRRPQIRLTKYLPLKDEVGLKFEGAVARTIGRTDPTGSESGEDAGFPTYQGRAGITLPFFGPKPTTIGFSGHWGQEEYDLTATSSRDFDSWSINLDVTQPVSEWLTVKGELFSGENLNTYFGGIGQGVNTTTLKEIYSKGGWIAAGLGPWSKCSVNLGLGVDDVDRDDVQSGSMTRNSSVFGNVIYSLNEHVQLGFELSHWTTNYRGPGDDADNTRAQTSFIYKF